MFASKLVRSIVSELLPPNTVLKPASAALVPRTNFLFLSSDNCSISTLETLEKTISLVIFVKPRN